MTNNNCGSSLSRFIRATRGAPVFSLSNTCEKRGITWRSCFAASAPALVWNVTKPTGWNQTKTYASFRLASFRLFDVSNTISRAFVSSSRNYSNARESFFYEFIIHYRLCNEFVRDISVSRAWLFFTNELEQLWKSRTFLSKSGRSFFNVLYRSDERFFF